MKERQPTPKEPPKKQSDEADKCGGTEDEWDIYVQSDTVRSCDKGGHKERSRNNDQGQHNEHWKKQQ